MRKFKILIVAILATSSLIAQVGEELYRPFFHYSPKSNWMNDPNGMVYYNGKYHLFYQYNPTGIQPANISWGHAVSSDLIHWDEKPVAIPAQNGVMAYSGSVVVDWNNTSGFGIDGKPPLVAIYTGASNVQDQRVAYSNDEGLTWTNYNQNPVINSNSNQFRDPKVFWHKGSQKWIMVVSTGAYVGIHLYSSPNLKNWTLLQVFGNVENISSYWECPDLFQLPVDNDTNNMKWVLVHSVAPTAQYFIGDFDGQNFTWQRSEPPGVLIDDFEGNNYGSWTKTGDAFGIGPSAPTTVAAGFLGNRFVYSFSPDNSSQGKLVSADFVIQKKYISFLIGGGYHPNNAYVKLVINGQAMRSSTGMNEDIMKWRNWDVSSWVGQTAHIEIIDSATLAWGHINIDHIIQSDIQNDNVNHGQVDYGKDFYAVQSFSDLPDRRRIWLAWMNNWEYATSIPTTPWKGIMSIPRELKLKTHNGKIKLVQAPVEELGILRKDTLSYKNTNLNVINNTVTNLRFKKFELRGKIAIENKKGFSLKFKKNGSQYSEFTLDFVNQQILFNRSKSGAFVDAAFVQLQVAPLIIENGFIDFHLFVDNSSAELFSGGGQVVMSNQIFPDSLSNKIELTTLDQDFIFEEFDIWNFEKQSVLLPPDPPDIPDTLHEKERLFRVYPNPVADNNGVTIVLKDDMVGKIRFKLFDVNGRLISEFHPTTNSIIIPRNKLTTGKGIFFLKGSTGQFTRVEKLLFL